VDEPSERVSAAVEQLCGGRFSGFLRDCGRETGTGVDELEEWREWSHRPPTADQRRIERHLGGFLEEEDSVLHVGVGGSELAWLFAPYVRLIHGITISSQERARAGSLLLSNYEVLVCNKYQYVRWPEAFDVIVDNNPVSYACCLRHVVEMLTSYADALSPRGALFTDIAGLSWVVTGADPRWKLDLPTLRALASAVGLTVVDVDGSVFALCRASGVERLLRLRRGSALRALVRPLLRPRLLVLHVPRRARQLVVARAGRRPCPAHSSGWPCRPRLTSERRRLPARRRSCEPRVGRVGRRSGGGGASASRSTCASRCSAPRGSAAGCGARSPRR
jgi:hypothetical protein